MQHHIKGFTLIELLIAVVIVGVLASIALPSYQQYVQRGYRTEALDAINIIMDAQERYFTDNRTYTTNLVSLGLPSNYETQNKRYKLKAQTCSNSRFIAVCVEVVAEAQGSQLGDGHLIFDSLGKKVREINGVEHSL